MVAAKPTVKLTYEDYRRTPEDERYELIDGELIMAAAPNMAHQTTQGKLGWRMASVVETEGLGYVFFSPCDIVLSEHNTLQPDIVFVSMDNAAIITDANIQGAPDLVVEIISPSSTGRDWVTKRDLYARYGVREYWLIDPVNRTLWVMRLRNGYLELSDTLSEGDTLTDSIIEGFSVSLSDIF